VIVDVKTTMISKVSKSREWILTVDLDRIRVSVGKHRDFTIGGLGSREPLHIEIAMRDFPKRSEPFMTRTRVRRSRGIGVRQFGISDNKKLTTGETPKPRWVAIDRWTYVAGHLRTEPA
jgi:hypothetical protein